MQAYQLGIAKFQKSGAKVFGISTDNTPSLKAFAEQLSLPFPLLSDFVDRKVSKSMAFSCQSMAWRTVSPL